MKSMLVVLMIVLVAVVPGSARAGWADLTYAQWKQSPEMLRGARVLGAMNMIFVLNSMGWIEGSCPAVSALEIAATLESVPSVIEESRTFGFAVLAAMIQRGCRFPRLEK